MYVRTYVRTYPVLRKRAYSAALNTLTFKNLDGSGSSLQKNATELIRRLNTLSLKKLIRRKESLFGEAQSLFGSCSELIRRGSELIRLQFRAHSAGSELIRRGGLFGKIAELIRRIAAV